MEMLNELYAAWQAAEEEFKVASADVHRLATTSDLKFPGEEQFAKVLALADRAKGLHARYTSRLKSPRSWIQSADQGS